MTKINYTKLIGDIWLEDVYAADSFKISAKAANSVTYVDKNGASIVLSGKGLKASSDGSLKAGTVTALDFLDATGGVLMIAKGATFDAKTLSAALMQGETIYGLMTLITAGDDKIVGNSGGEQFIPGYNAGNDKIIGRGGDDFVSGSMGNKTMDGGSGYDTLSYQNSFYDKAHAKKGIVLDVVGKTVENSWGGIDKIKNFEAYRGSYLADKMTGSAADEQFSGLGGKDVIDGGDGFDTARYERDERFGGKKGIVANLEKGTVKDGFGSIDTVRNIEAVRGTSFADTFKGDAGDNQFRGLGGTDKFDGGLGYDTVSFNSSGADNAHGVSIDMTRATSQVQDDGFGKVETLKGIEKIQGSQFDDVIVLGDTAFDIQGGAGNDRLTAGAGENIMNGEDGADTFVFLSASASQAGTSTRDFIADFSQADGDRLDLAALGPLVFTGEGPHTVGTATLAYFFNTDGNTVVGADANGDGITELQFLLHGKIALSASDFILA